MEVTAVFDIGKTNKKFFLFDREFNKIETKYVTFDEVSDGEGFVSDDLAQLSDWVKTTLQQALQNPNYTITHLNFSAYGASLVHLDENNERVAPFYNYLKPFPKELEMQFEEKYGIEAFQEETSSPFMGFLNSGLQLYYLKYKQPALFASIKRSLHFPQYLSFLITNELVAEYTSLGCHTGLWDASQKQYARWVKKEALVSFFPSLLPASSSKVFEIEGNQLTVGVGMHDSSAALIPYLFSNPADFVLVSTGTWSICMNPHNHQKVTQAEMALDCLNFMDANGDSVKASRLLLGKHLSEQVEQISQFFHVDNDHFKTLKWNDTFQPKRKNRKKLLFDHALIVPERFGFVNGPNPDYAQFDGFEDALRQLYDELTDIQIASLNLVLDKGDIKKVYVDGGIGNSEVFMQFMANKLSAYEVYTSSFPLGSALGAALVMHHQPNELSPGFLSTFYNLKRILPKS